MSITRTILKEKPRFNYSGHGWEGKMYRDDFTTKDIAENIRYILKKQYPKCKFSVSKQSYSGGSSISVALIKSDKNPFAIPNIEVCQKSSLYGTAEEKLASWKLTLENGHHGINQFYIKNDFYLNDFGQEIMIFANDLINSYNFDDSEAMIDYFHVNFYSHLSIGKWDKPFELLTNTKL